MPCVWALLTSKSEHLYYELLHSIIVVIQYNWIPSICIIYFKKA
ncbi:hypothetical protein MXB_5599 [Myxobolus squamalis]|nr:hypothetical protein MXB_5599 [Myxobolus squamalis]